MKNAEVQNKGSAEEDSTSLLPFPELSACTKEFRSEHLLQGTRHSPKQCGVPGPLAIQETTMSVFSALCWLGEAELLLN